MDAETLKKELEEKIKELKEKDEQLAQVKNSAKQFEDKCKEAKTVNAKLQQDIQSVIKQADDYKKKNQKLQVDVAEIAGQSTAYKTVLEQSATNPHTPAKPDFTSQLLLKPFSGQEVNYSASDFMTQFERVAKAGRWGNEEILLVAENKLTGAAKAALHANKQISTSQEPLKILRTILEGRFIDRTPDHYLRELNSAKQSMGESVLAFADRVTELGQRAVPGSKDHSIDQAKWTNDHRDALILASYLNGLQGDPGLQLQYNPPTTMIEARQRAATVERVHKEREPARDKTRGQSYAPLKIIKGDNLGSDLGKDLYEKMQISPQGRNNQPKEKAQPSQTGRRPPPANFAQGTRGFYHSQNVPNNNRTYYATNSSQITRGPRDTRTPIHYNTAINFRQPSAPYLRPPGINYNSPRYQTFYPTPTTHSEPRRYQPSRSFSNQCYQCGGTNHFRRDCRAERACFICRKTSHLKKDCPDSDRKIKFTQRPAGNSKNGATGGHQ